MTPLSFDRTRNPAPGQESSTFVEADDGTRLHVRHLAHHELGPIALLVHGYGEGGHVWYETCAALAGLGPISVLDLRGHGDSESSRSGRYDLATHAGDVLAVIRALPRRPVILVGHSLGGLASLLVTAQQGDLVRALVVVDACPNPSQVGAAKVSSNLRAALRVYPSVDEYRLWLGQTQPLLAPRTADGLAQRALRPCPGGFELKLDPAMVTSALRRSASSTRLGLGEMLPQIGHSVTLIRGSASALVSATAAERMIERLPRGRLVTIPRSGHAVMSDNPIDFNRALGELLRQEWR